MPLVANHNPQKHNKHSLISPSYFRYRSELVKTLGSPFTSSYKMVKFLLKKSHLFYKIEDEVTDEKVEFYTNLFNNCKDLTDIKFWIKIKDQSQYWFEIFLIYFIGIRMNIKPPLEEEE